jgi:hypothetical protein
MRAPPLLGVLGARVPNVRPDDSLGSTGTRQAGRTRRSGPVADATAAARSVDACPIDRTRADAASVQKLLLRDECSKGEAMCGSGQSLGCGSLTLIVAVTLGFVVYALGVMTSSPVGW